MPVNANSTHCTVSAIASYANLNQPRAFGEQEPVYSSSLIVSKDDVTSNARIESAMRAAYEAGLATLQGRNPNPPTFEEVTANGPVHDGDVKKPGDAAYKNSYYLNAKNRRKPGIVDINKNEILDPSEIYSGIKVKAAISFYAYNKNGNKGIGVSLDYIMKVADGEPLGSTISLDEAFPDDDDDFLS